MKPYVWYSKATSKTGKALARALGLSNDGTKRGRHHGVKVPSAGTTHVISWGARQPTNRVEFRRRNLARRKVLNNPYNTEVYKDKLKALLKMEHGGVNVPRFAWYKQRDIIDSGTLTYPLIGRTRYHYGGSGFKFIENAEQLRIDNQSDYWMEYIGGEDKREYRVHVFKDTVIRVQRKKPKLNERGEEIEPRSYVCRSNSNGWRFSLCDINRIHIDILEQAIKAVRVLGYDFGAVDIIRVPITNSTYVLEVNSGMGLDNAGLSFYLKLFKNWLEVN